jgi:hypothetical protein
MNRSPVRLTFAAAVVLGATLRGGAVFALDPAEYATFGLLVSVPLGASMDNVGIGVEGSYHWQPDTDGYLGAGGFVQAQFLLSGGWRLGAGAQANFAVAGAELGLALTAPHFTDPSLGLHLAPYLSVGYASAAFRWTRRLVGDSAAPNDFALAFTAKAWWHLPQTGDAALWTAPCGVYRACSVAVPGRPLMVDGAPVTASLLGGLPRDRAAAHWARAALDEHASIASFARASLTLMALGAPAALVARTHAAALDEVDHARRCAALASRLAGRPMSFGPLPQCLAPHAPADLADFAAATLVEGCINEGAAAEVARRAALAAADPEAREALSVLARDEARHAELAWDTVAWCCDAGGDAVRRRLADALDALPTPARGASGALDAASRALGLTDDALGAACLASALRAARRRVGRARSPVALAA